MNTNPTELTSTTEKVARKVSVCSMLLCRMLVASEFVLSATTARPPSTTASTARPATSSHWPRPTVTWRWDSTTSSAHTACSPMDSPTKLTRAGKLSMNTVTKASTSSGGTSSGGQRAGRPWNWWIAAIRPTNTLDSSRLPSMIDNPSGIRPRSMMSRWPMALTSRAAAQRPRPSRRRPQPTTAMEAAIMRELAMIIASMVGTWAAMDAGGQ